MIARGEKPSPPTMFCPICRLDLPIKAFPAHRRQGAFRARSTATCSACQSERARFRAANRRDPALLNTYYEISLIDRRQRSDVGLLPDEHLAEREARIAAHAARVAEMIDAPVKDDT